MDYTGYLLRTAFLRAATIAAREFGAEAHPRDAAVIATLQAYGPLSQQQLANGLNVNRTAMVKLIDGLEARGLVERIRNRDDRRAYALHATRAGLESMTEMLPRMARAEAELTEALSETEHARLNELVRALIPPPPPALADRTGFLLARAHHRFHERADEVLRPYGIQVRQFGALTRLADGTSWSSWSTGSRRRGWPSAGATPPTGALTHCTSRGEAATCSSALLPCCWPRTRT
jgi:DNA-binding MarR family transcriptional regulator